MAASELVRSMRRMGAAGIWMPPGPKIALDVSGRNRHAVQTSGTGVAQAGWCPDNRYPGYDGVGENSSPYVATVGTVLSNSTTLVVHVNVPTTSETGGFMQLCNAGFSGGCGMGVGNGAYGSGAFGNTLAGLNEAIAFHNTSTAIPVGWRLITVVFGTGASEMRFFIDETLVASLTMANFAAGPDQIHIGGYASNSRATSCIIGTTGFFDRKLSDGEAVHLAKCARRDRAPMLPMAA